MQPRAVKELPALVSFGDESLSRQDIYESFREEFGYAAIFKSFLRSFQHRLG